MTGPRRGSSVRLAALHPLPHHAGLHARAAAGRRGRRRGVARRRPGQPGIPTTMRKRGSRGTGQRCAEPHDGGAAAGRRVPAHRRRGGARRAHRRRRRPGEAAAATSGDLTRRDQAVRGALVAAGQAIEQRRDCSRPADRVHRGASSTAATTLAEAAVPLGPARIRRAGNVAAGLRGARDRLRRRGSLPTRRRPMPRPLSEAARSRELLDGCLPRQLAPPASSAWAVPRARR